MSEADQKYTPTLGVAVSTPYAALATVDPTSIGMSPKAAANVPRTALSA
ncbi:hypothetical protein ACFQ9X_41895 [Catenulispora yoronensis]